MPISVLFDTGASVSIVARKFVDAMKLPTEIMPRIYLVKIASSQCLFTNDLSKDCELVVGKTKVMTNLLVLDIPKYDLVLGMNWLSMHNIRIDCAKKEITLPDGEVHALVNSKELVYEMRGTELEVLDEIPVISKNDYGYALNELHCKE